MIKALIKDKVTLTAERGSVVIVSESQFMALGAKAVAYKQEAKEVVEDKVEVVSEDPVKIPEEPKKATSKKTSKGRK